MSTRRHFLLATASASTAVALAGCSIVRPSPIKATFLLEPAMPSPVAKPQPGVLRIGAINVAAPYRGRAFIVRDSDLKFESDYYYEFLAAPGGIIGDATTRALTSARVFAAVLPLAIPNESDWLLEGFVGAIYGDARSAAQAAAVMQITYYLSRSSSGTAIPFWTRGYERRIAFEGGSTNRYVVALNTALGEILAELTKDLATMSLPAL
ncbi:MAG: hypothetical protein ABI777_03665 [Betaproteobacteria bacterium]